MGRRNSCMIKKMISVNPIRINPISIGGRGGGWGWYNVPQGYIFVENSCTANDFKLKFSDF